MDTTTTDRTRDERKRAYEHVLGIIEHQTVYQQPAFIPRHRVGMIADFGSDDFDGLGSILRAAVGNGDLLRVNRRTRDGTETLYAYARAPEHLRAVIETVREWDPTPEDVVAYCANRIDELEDR